MSRLLYVHGKCPESRALILCLVYTRQSKGISCASSNSNVIRSGGSRRRDYSINTNTIFGGHTLKRKTTLTTQSRVGEYDCGWNHAAADYLRCSKGACTHLDASDLISLLDVLLVRESMFKECSSKWKSTCGNTQGRVANKRIPSTTR